MRLIRMREHPRFAAVEAAAPALEVRDLHVAFDDGSGTVRAVDGVTFKVAPGRTMGIVGESGCGKSVTARAILRIVEPHCRVSGQVFLRRKDGVHDLMQLAPNSRQMREIRGREIALVFQEPMVSFSPVHTVGNQIIETIRLHCALSKADAREKAVQQLKLVSTPHPEHILDQYAWQLSGGLRQRAMIAMALACGPAVLIADEPTTALDVTTQAQVLELLRELQRERAMGLMLITHDLGVVAETADDVIVMYLGVVVEEGPVDVIFHEPKHPYTRALLESMPDVAARPRTRLTTLQGSVPHPLNRPAGCPFHPRCSRAIPGVCDRVAPARTTVGTRHSVSCHLYPAAEASFA
jgi:peptide/nickel transport system ATP-binding protein